VAYATTGPDVVDFSDIATAPFPGVVYDGILVSGGVSFAERFVGQVLSINGDLDVLSGTPTGPLTLQTGAAGQNLDGGADAGFVGLYPCGFKGCTAADGYGEGSFAMRFPSLITGFGFQANFGDLPSSVFVDVFRSDGSLIDSLTVAMINGGFTFNSFGFAREGGVRDIAGVSIYTNDPGGLSYDNIRFDGVRGGQAVPEPATFLLLGSGLLVAGLRRRLKTRR
jgi:hypothetical protein